MGGRGSEACITAGRVQVAGALDTFIGIGWLLACCSVSSTINLRDARCITAGEFQCAGAHKVLGGIGLRLLGALPLACLTQLSLQAAVGFEKASAIGTKTASLFKRCAVQDL